MLRSYLGHFHCTKHPFNKTHYISSSSLKAIKTPTTKPQSCCITKRRAHLSYNQTPAKNKSIRNHPQENPTYEEWQISHNHEDKRGQVNTYTLGLPEWVWIFSQPFPQATNEVRFATTCNLQLQIETTMRSMQVIILKQENDATKPDYHLTCQAFVVSPLSTT